MPPGKRERRPCVAACDWRRRCGVFVVAQPAPFPPPGRRPPDAAPALLVATAPPPDAAAVPAADRATATPTAARDTAVAAASEPRLLAAASAATSGGVAAPIRGGVTEVAAAPWLAGGVAAADVAAPAMSRAPGDGAHAELAAVSSPTERAAAVDNLGGGGKGLSCLLPLSYSSSSPYQRMYPHRRPGGALRPR